MTAQEKMAAIAEEEKEQKLSDQELTEEELKNIAGGGPPNRHR